MTILLGKSASGRLLLAIFGCLAVLLSLHASHRSVAQATKGDGAGKDVGAKDAKYLGAGTCVNCHCGKSGTYTDDLVLLNEYATWRLYDRHAAAYLALLGPRGQKIASRLGVKDVTDRKAGCLGCHAINCPDEQRDPTTFRIRFGVSCEACHGPAEHWIGPHAQKDKWRAKSAADKEKEGMRDLRNPSVRAELCLSCHLGNAAEGKVLTHAMYAAGHPPLTNFEVAAASHALPRHWRNKRDVPYFKAATPITKKLYHLDTADSQEAQLVAAGSLGSLRSLLNLVETRAALDATLNDEQRLQRWPELMLSFPGNEKPLTLERRWPEVALAHSDCYGCHHELRQSIKQPDGSYVSWRQLRGYAGKPGRPQVRPWPVALARRGVGIPEDGDLPGRLRSLVAVCDKQPFGSPGELARAAALLTQRIDEQVGNRSIQDTTVDGLKLLRDLCVIAPEEFPDFESARQIACAIQVLYDGLVRKPIHDKEIRDEIAGVAKELMLHHDSGKKDRLVLVLRMILATRMKREPRKDDMRLDPEVLAELDRATSQGVTKELEDKRPEIAHAIREIYDAVRGQNPDRLTEAIVADPQFLTTLNNINDKEYRALLSRISQYDPVAFKKRLTAIGRLLP